MARDPAVLFYTSDFLSGTYELTYVERGMYITMLCIQHQKENNEIPKDYFDSIIPIDSPLRNKFVITVTGYYNNRMRIESDKRKAFCQSRRDSVSKRYVRTTHVDTHVEHTNVRMENENENENVIEYLNLKCNTFFRTSGKSTQRHINARIAEGFKLEDFKAVIDFKSNEWINKPDMKQYLRPETLFGTKFEGYLQAAKSDNGLKIVESDAEIIDRVFKKKEKNLEKRNLDIGNGKATEDLR